MDESDYYLRAFVKSRNQNQVTKLKLKKVVADIILAQKVRHFLLKIQPTCKFSTRKTFTSVAKRRYSVRLISPKDSRGPIHSGSSRRNVTEKPGVVNSEGSSHQDGPPAALGAPLAPSKPDEVPSGTSGYRKDKSNIHDEVVRRASLYSSTSLTSNVDKMPHIANKFEKQSRNIGKRPHFGMDLSGTVARSGTAGTKKGNSSTLPPLLPQMWVGDPKAIGSVRRPRKNPKEMTAAYKSGEDSRRLLREMTFPCTRNCHKPNLMTELDRIYLELPSIVPAIVKARAQMEQESAGTPYSDRPSLSLLAIPAASPGKQQSHLIPQLSQDHRASLVLQTPTVRPHGVSFSQIATTAALGVHHTS